MLSKWMEDANVANEPIVRNASNSAIVGRRVLGPQEGDILGAATAVRDRFMVETAGGGFSLVEHLMPPRSLAAPLHRHSREDEYSYVLEGKVGAHFDGVEVFANAGDLIFKPRGEWHTFWNAGDAPARILEIISPGGFEKAFRELHAFGDALDEATVTQVAVDGRGGFFSAKMARPR